LPLDGGGGDEQELGEILTGLPIPCDTVL